MKFSHLADCHIGSWRDEKLNNLSTEAFVRALDISLEKQVDFILIAGDIFNTSVPPIEKLKTVTKKLREVKEKNVPVYIIPGSHDFSPSGKTMLDVLEHAGLFVNVVKGTVLANNKLQLKFTVDKKTGAKITGVMGKKGSLERKYYEALDMTNLEQEEGFKIFLFHTALTELKPAELERMESQPVSFLPKNFDYYAGGHVHIVKEATLPGYKNIVYPGPLFPNSFSELEKLKQGSFVLYDNGMITHLPLVLHPTISIVVHAQQESAQAVQQRLLAEVRARLSDVQNAIVTLRVTGELSEGKTGDLDFVQLRQLLEQHGAYFVMRSTTLLKTKEFDEIRVKGENTAEIEEKILQEHLGQFLAAGFSKEAQERMTKELLHLFATEKQEGERIIDFENRLRKEVAVLLEIKL